MKMHRWLDFKVTRRCNNYSRKCAYCDVAVEPEHSPETLSLDDIHLVLADAFALGFDVFWLLGGEPTLRSDCDRLFDPLADEPEVSLTLVTNGKLRREDAYRALYATSARRACVQVSLDTLLPGNVKRADPGKTLRLVADLGRLARRMSTPSHDCAVEVHCVVTRENMADFDEFAAFFAAKGVGVSLAMVCPWRETRSPERLNEFTRSELESVAGRIEKLSTGLGIDEFNPLVARFIRRILDRGGAEGTRPCGAGLTHLVVNGDGAVFKCMADSFRPENTLGNVLAQRLHEVLGNCGSPSLCREGSSCFDGFAWDAMALDKEGAGCHG